jgi:hypothetical protein
VFENRALRRRFRPKRDEIIGDWRILHNEELYNLESPPNTIRMIMSRRMRRAGQLAHMEEKRNAYRILMRKPEGKRPLGRPRHRWEDNIKMDVRVIGWGDMDWIYMIQDSDQWLILADTVIKSGDP